MPSGCRSRLPPHKASPTSGVWGMNPPTHPLLHSPCKSADHKNPGPDKSPDTCPLPNHIEHIYYFLQRPRQRAESETATDAPRRRVSSKRKSSRSSRKGKSSGRPNSKPRISAQPSATAAASEIQVKPQKSPQSDRIGHFFRGPDPLGPLNLTSRPPEVPLLPSPFLRKILARNPVVPHSQDGRRKPFPTWLPSPTPVRLPVSPA